MMRWLRVTAPALLVAALAAPAHAEASTGWHLVQHPGPGDTRRYSPEATSVSCASQTHCVSIGTYDSIDPSLPHRAFLATTDPTARSTVAVAGPLPRDADTKQAPQLDDVSCGAGSRCVAVGSYTRADGNFRPMIETQAGDDRWQVAKGPGVPHDDNGELVRVACSLQSCVATGDAGGEPLIIARIGGSWVAQSVTLPDGETLDGPLQPACPAVGVCVALGTARSGSDVRPVLLYPSGSGGWMAVNLPMPAGVDPATVTFGAIACSSTANCIAYGSYDQKPFAGDQKLLAEVLTDGVLSVQNVHLPATALANPGLRPASASCSSGAEATCVGIVQFGRDSPDDGLHGTLFVKQEDGILKAQVGTSGFQNHFFDVSCFLDTDQTTSCVAVGWAGKAMAKRYRHGAWRPTQSLGRPTGIAPGADWTSSLGFVSCAAGSCAAIGGWGVRDDQGFPLTGGAVLATMS